MRCSNLCQRMEGRNFRGNYTTQFWCSECEAWIPVKYLAKKYGLVCLCCNQQVRRNARKKIKQFDENYVTQK